MMFVDEARIFVKGGDGGKGCESYYRDKYMRHPKADGGDGGNGGDVVFVADKSIQTLLDYKYKQHHKAKKGNHGSSKNKKGREGQDCVLRVPIGTILRDNDTGLLIKDLVADSQSVIVAKGGAGGIGNARRRNVVPPGFGEERTISLELKLIADVGLVGFPNAGKSTLISNISRVRSKIASYPFTTKQPILGFVSGDELDFVVADLPGIIEGAHQGRGLGDRFLRHAERTKVLLHIVDIAGSENRDPLEDYEKINHELQSYSDKFVFKHKIVALNKIDLPDSEKNIERFRQKYDEEVYLISASEKSGLDTLVDKLRVILCQENSQDKSNE